METVAPFPEVIDEIRAAGGDAFTYCYQCGKCDVVCPWNRVRDFSIRKIVLQASLGIPDIELDEIWRCTTCGRCPSECPRGVNQIDIGVAIRRIATAYDVFPAPVSGYAPRRRQPGQRRQPPGRSAGGSATRGPRTCR